ncbi:hypothetical protein JXB41_05400 [Candidatus Woesearchaeota archaeon]|nr:hypothetical protein [Candidatus Woesearchaeota archaeon]
MENIRLFREVTENDQDIVGIKGLSLAKLSQNRFGTSPGFIVTSNAYLDFIEKDSLKNHVRELLSKIEKDYSNIEEISSQIKKLIMNASFPENIEEDIIDSYHSLGFDISKSDASSLLETNEVFVAVRSSYLHALKPGADIGYPTMLNIKGTARLLNSIKKCYCSFFDPKSIKYRIENNLASEHGLAVIIQKMVNADKAGVSYSINIESQNNNEILIKACFGLGEAIVTSSIYPDSYIVNKIDLSIKDIKISEKEFEFILDRDTEKTAKHFLKDKGKGQVLTYNEILEIARLTKRISSQLQKQEKIEWAIKGDKIYIFQSKEIFMKDPQLTSGKETTERIELEIYEPNEEEKIPDVVDIDEEYDLEKDLEVLDEIEKQETGETKENSIDIKDIEDALIPNENKQSEQASESDEKNINKIEENQEWQKQGENIEPHQEHVEDDTERVEETINEIPEEQVPEVPEEHQEEQIFPEEISFINDTEEEQKQEEPLENPHEPSGKAAEEPENQNNDELFSEEEIDEIMVTSPSGTEPEPFEQFKEEIQMPEEAPESEKTNEDDSADKSIFSSIEGFKTSEPELQETETINKLREVKIQIDPKKILEKALFNSGNVIVTCDMAIISKLKNKYFDKYNEETRSFNELTENLNEEIGDYLEDIRRIHELKTDFLEGIIEPSPKDIELALRIAKEFVEKD